MRMHNFAVTFLQGAVGTPRSNLPVIVVTPQAARAWGIEVEVEVELRGTGPSRSSFRFVGGTPLIVTKSIEGNNDVAGA